MKKLFTSLLCLGLLGLALAMPASAYEPVTLTVPTVQAAATSNSVNQVIDVRKQDYVALQWVVTGSTNVIVRIGSSVDGVTYATNSHVIAGMTVGTPMVTNIFVGGLHSLRIDSVTSTGTLIATNAVTYGVKRNFQ